MWFDISYLLNILNNLICYNLICDVTLSFQYNKDNYHSYTYTYLYITNKSNKLWMQYKIVIVKKIDVHRKVQILLFLSLISRYHIVF